MGNLWLPSQSDIARAVLLAPAAKGQSIGSVDGIGDVTSALYTDDVPDLLRNTTEWTFSTWAQITSTSAANVFIYLGTAGTSADDWLSLLHAANGDGFRAMTYGQVGQVYSSNTGVNAETNRWYHVAATFREPDLRQVFVNGVPYTAETSSTSVSPGNFARIALMRAMDSTPCCAGYNRVTGSTIFPEILSHAEIAELARGQNPFNLRRRIGFFYDGNKERQCVVGDRVQRLTEASNINYSVDLPKELGYQPANQTPYLISIPEAATGTIAPQAYHHMRVNLGC